MFEWFRNQSLRTKLLAVFLGPTLTIVLLYGLLAYDWASEGLEEELGDRLVAVGQAVSADLSDEFDARLIDRLDASNHRVRKRLRKRLRKTRNRTDVQRIHLFNRDVESLVDSRGEMAFGQTVYAHGVHRFEIQEMFETGEATTSVLFEGEDGRLYKSAYVPIELEGEVVAALAVEASPEYFGLLTNFATVLTALGAGGLLLVIIAGTLFARALTRPVGRLVEAARRLGRGELEEPVVELDEMRPADQQRDEIAFLARTFEEMRRDVRERDRRLKMMLSGIAHEVRNPLGGMELFCGLLREDLEASGDEEALEKVDRIEREVDYLDRVVDEFRDYARETELQWDRFRAADLARELERAVRADLDDAECELEIDIPADLEVTADRDQLRQVLHNLVRNARQACAPGGSIELVAEAPEADVRRWLVRDDGPGIPKEARDDLFTPFHTTKEKGSGLGLPLTKQIVESHGGTLTVESDEQGTTVTVELPFEGDVDSGGAGASGEWLG